MTREPRRTPAGATTPRGLGLWLLTQRKASGGEARFLPATVSCPGEARSSLRTGLFRAGLLLGKDSKQKEEQGVQRRCKGTVMAGYR